MKSKNNFAAGEEERVKIKSKIETLLSLVQKLGEAGRLLEDEIKNFLEGRRVIRINPAHLAGLVQQNIEEREQHVVVTINPMYIRGVGRKRNKTILLDRIQKREGSVISSMSTVRKNHSELPPESKHERFKAD